jgi:uncharacterized membrane protein YoaK (UPF0700 family)
VSEDRGSRLGRVALALTLATVAGAVDAIAYSELGNLFVSFMSGNSTRLGVDLAGRDWSGALPVAISILLFVAGSFVGTLLADIAPPWNLPLVVGFEAAIVGGAALFVGITGTISALYVVAFAMGMQNAVHPTVAGAGIGKSFVTGTLFGVGQALAQGLREGRALLASLANLLSWAAFVAGAVLGTMALARLGTAPTLATIAGGLVILALGLLIHAARTALRVQARSA